VRSGGTQRQAVALGEHPLLAGRDVGEAEATVRCGDAALAIGPVQRDPDVGDGVTLHVAHEATKLAGGRQDDLHGVEILSFGQGDARGGFGQRAGLVRAL